MFIESGRYQVNELLRAKESYKFFSAGALRKKEKEGKIEEDKEGEKMSARERWFK